jgi:hypothetical protein
VALENPVSSPEPSATREGDARTDASDVVHDQTLDPHAAIAQELPRAGNDDGQVRPVDPDNDVKSHTKETPRMDSVLDNTQPVLPPTPIPADDPFDLEKSRMGQDFGGPAAVKKLITDVAVGKPNREWFVRVRPEPEHRHQDALVRLKEGDVSRGFYWVAPALLMALKGLPALATLIRGYQLFTGVNRAGRPLLWPIPLPDEKGEVNSWHASELEAARAAMAGWVRIEADMKLSGNVIYTAEVPLSEPDWPDLTLQELVRLGFKQRIIDSLDHPVIRQLRGLE